MIFKGKPCKINNVALTLSVGRYVLSVLTLSTGNNSAMLYMSRIPVHHDQLTDTDSFQIPLILSSSMLFWFIIRRHYLHSHLGRACVYRTYAYLVFLSEACFILNT